MTSIKRLTSIVTLVVFMFSMFAVNVFADSTFSDVTSDTQYAAAIEKLYQDGIVDGYLAADGTRSFKPLDTITRGEFAKLLVVAKIKNVATTLTATTCGFEDVNSDPTVSWTIPYVDYAAKASIVNGYEDGTFRAKNTVTYAEAVKMIVCAMGYSSVIEKTEPWYDGYIKVAQQIGILNQAAGDADAPAPRGLVAQLICNMTTSNKEITVVPGINGGSTSSGGNFIIKGDDDEDVETAIGVVTAVFNQGIEGEAGCAMDEIKIGALGVSGLDIVFKIGNFSLENMYQYLGKYVEVTYTVKNSKNTIQSISTEGFNNEVTVEADDIDVVEESYLEYYKESSKKNVKVSFSSSMKVIHNGVGVPSLTGALTKSLLSIDNGSIRFIDCDGNGKYDTAFVSTYETFFVGTVESTTKTITDKYIKNGNVLKTISFDDIEVENIEYKTSTGSSASFGSIRANNVVSVAKPYNDNTTYAKTSVVISSATAQGSVNSIDSKGNYEIGEKEIKSSQYYLNLIQQEPSQEMKHGDTVTCYLDYEGKVVAISATDTTKYGYIVDVIIPESGNRDDVQIRLVVGGSSTSSTPTNYSLKSSVKVNGEPYSPREIPALLEQSATVIYSGASNKIESGKEMYAKYCQPIIFKTSGSNKTIANITTIATSGEADCIEYGQGKTNGSTGLKYRNGNYFQDGSGSTFVNMNFTSSTSSSNPSTKVFFVPLDRSDEDGYTAYASTSKPSKFVNNKSFYIDAFNVNNTKNAEIVVVYGGNALEITGNSKTIMIKKVTPSSEKVDSNGYKIEYYDFINNKEVAANPLYTDGKIDVSDLKGGDIIKYELKDSLVALVEKVYADGSLYDPADETGSQSTVEYYTQRSNSDNADYYNAYYGVAYSASGSLSIVKFSDIEGISASDDDYEAKIDALSAKNVGNIGSAKLFVVDTTKNTVEITAFDNVESVIRPIKNATGNDDIAFASRVFVSRQDETIKAIVAYK